MLLRTSPARPRSAAAIQAWWPQIEAFILTGVTNAATEAGQSGDEPSPANFEDLTCDASTTVITCVLIGGAGAGEISVRFSSAVQALEVIGGAVKMTLMSLNVRDGMLLTGRIRRRKPHKVRPETGVA
jgi:hypothetical protein